MRGGLVKVLRLLHRRVTAPAASSFISTRCGRASVAHLHPGALRPARCTVTPRARLALQLCVLTSPRVCRRCIALKSHSVSQSYSPKATNIAIVRPVDESVYELRYELRREHERVLCTYVSRDRALSRAIQGLRATHCSLFVEREMVV